MKRNTLFAAVTGALVLGSAGVASAGQQLVCDQQPSSTTSASCRYIDMPASSSAPAGSTYYIVEPAPAERTVVREPVRERVVIQEPAPATPVDTVVMSYPVDDAFPDPNPRQVAQTRVYVPREPVTLSERGFFGEVTPD